ncbi:DUF6644 family protein [Rheinheimera nanhaiensis]|uniref:DUF6644 domain-containing protein n=1 Tax=Rheinheimera nanhaiensis E407-8 TaxID=562729 RepID=I1DXF0_9GAMM|nr:DUF6644 family protein [Rheinheimera nanhaiensis]GAB58728.1 hypothetical protein RNAN_1716 [Rheinheimera nanhaiensis E407-8]
MFEALLLSLAESAVASALRQSVIGYPLLSAVHILGLALLVGSIVTLDLRLLNIIKRSRLSELASLLSRVAAGGLMLAVLSGLLLFSVQPAHYLANNAFLLKLALISLALLNAAVVHSLTAWRALLAGQPATLLLKVTAGISMMLWLAILTSGRWIAFV